jgi:hypothetical protein
LYLWNTGITICITEESNTDRPSIKRKLPLLPSPQALITHPNGRYYGYGYSSYLLKEHEKKKLQTESIDYTVPVLDIY